MHTHNKFYFKHKFDCALHGALLILFFLQRLGDFVLAHINHSFFFNGDKITYREGYIHVLSVKLIFFLIYCGIVYIQ